MSYPFKRFYQIVTAVVLMSLQTMLPLHAEPLPAKDEKAVQSVVQNQLAAFAADNADKAFSYAAPELRKAIGSSAAFMTMVKNSYPVVYRPASVAFLRAEGLGVDAVQRVQMQDASGASYLAVYSLQRQKDKTWRISGCTVVESKGRMT